MAKNKIMFHEGREVRVIAEGEGWSMVRRKGAMPFVVRSSELSQPTKRAIDGATVSPIERDWSGEVEDEAWAYLQKPPRN